MNILFDQTEAQALFYNGAAEYAQTVFFKILDMLKDYPSARVFSIYSSDREFRYEMLSYKNLSKYERVICVDYKNNSLKEIISEKKIDILFITCLQAFCDLPLGNLNNIGCKVVAVIHDFLDEEMNTSNILSFKHMNTPITFIRYQLSRAKVRFLSGKLKNRTKIMEDMLKNNNMEIITVSEYSKNSFRYNYPKLENNISVFYSPQKIVHGSPCNVENKALQKLIESKTPFVLLLSADRVLKNATSMLKAYKRFLETTKTNIKLVTVGYRNEEFEGHISLPFLSSSDLDIAYRNCYALLYPSLFEGFGYPPLEAMKYSKPVLSSNVCSMPEILGDAPIYFSPIYETDMFQALVKFVNTNYEQLASKAKAQYKIISQKQQSDLLELAEKILNGSFIK